MTTLSEVKTVQPEWFSRKNKKFFGDISYRILHGKKSKRPFLVRKTNGWVNSSFWKINPLTETLNIESMIDDTFRNIDAVKEWLKEN